MSLTYGFYNSVFGDRVYDAEQFSAMFDGLIADGVYETFGNKLMVSATNPASMSVNIGTGRAWFNHTWTLNDSVLPLELAESDLTYGRIDLVILEVNRETNTRANDIKIVTGTPASSPVAPTIVNSGDVHQYVLAEIAVSPRSTSITQASITNKVGTSGTPFVTGIIEMMDIDDLVRQWWAQWDADILQRERDYDSWTASKKSEYDSWVAEKEQYILDRQAEFEAWVAGFESDAEGWMQNEKDAFTTWLSHIKGQLDTDAAGHLQLEIDDTKDDIETYNSINDFEDGLDSITTVFNDDGSITTTGSTYEKLTTFNTDGSITEVMRNRTTQAVIYSKTTTFNTDGSITENVIRS